MDNTPTTLTMKWPAGALIASVLVIVVSLAITDVGKEGFWSFITAFMGLALAGLSGALFYIRHMINRHELEGEESR